MEVLVVSETLRKRAEGTHRQIIPQSEERRNPPSHYRGGGELTDKQLNWRA